MRALRRVTLLLPVLGRRRRRSLGLGQDDGELGPLGVQPGPDGAGVAATGHRDHLEEARPPAAVGHALPGDLQPGRAVGLAPAGGLQLLPPGAVHDLQLLLPEP